MKLVEKQNLFYFSQDLEQNQSQTIEAKLKIPASYNGSAGSKNGTLIIWATAE